MNGKLIAVISLSALLGPAAAFAEFNLACVDRSKNEFYTISVVNDQVHLCGAAENGVIGASGKAETNLRQVELGFFGEVSPGRYDVRFSVGTKGACPRCIGDVEHVSGLHLDCELKALEAQMCRAKVQGPDPDLGPAYNKALRHGVGEFTWVKVPWITLYSPADKRFDIYTFGGKHLDEISGYSDSYYYHRWVEEADFRAEVAARLKAGWKLHSYSTNKEGLDIAAKLLGYQIK